MTTRSVRYNDHSVQEAYHAAESFQVLLKPKNNFLSGMTSEDLKTFKRRMMGAILATDMAKHTEDVEAFKRTLQAKGITGANNNGNLFLDKSNGKTLFESQQQVLEYCLHSSDVSIPCRNFKLVK
jgi:hypothetical protein